MIMMNSQTNSPLLPQYQTNRHHPEYNQLRDQRFSSYDNRQRKHSEIAEPRDRQLYELCQQLTRQNRLLKKQNVSLKKQLQSRWSQDDAGVEREYEDDYRQINYEGYKRKIVQVMSSLRYLVDVYTEKQSINQVNNVLADLKEKMQRGNTNSVLELISIFNDKIRHEDRECSDLDCLMREAASKQVSVLRNHIKLMYRLIMDTVIVMRKDIAQVEQEMHYNRDRISHEIDYFCSKYTPVLPSSNIGLKQKRLSTNSQLSQAKQKKCTKKNKENVGGPKAACKELPVQRDKKEAKKSQNNINDLHQREANNLQDESRLQYYSLPLSKKVARPPKPASILTKHETTLIDQMQLSKNTGVSCAITPNSRKKINKSALKDSHCNYSKKDSQNWSSQNSGRKFYR